jgi:protein SCO1/2
MNRRAFFSTGAGAGMALAALGLPSASNAASFRQDGADWFTNVELQTHEGRTVRFYDDLLKDKIVLVNFMFTDCGDVCPGMTQNLADVQKLLGDRVGRDIFMYSISLQPEIDTPEKLKDYADMFDVGPGWLFLTVSATTSSCFATASASSTPIPSRMPTSNSTSARCASPTCRCIAG